MNTLAAAPLRIIVTADDFGISASVDQGIRKAFEEGIVGATALLVNFPEFEESLERLRDAQGLEVSVHLNLTCGPPVSDPTRVGTLVGRDGCFRDLKAFAVRALSGGIDWSEVGRECRAQIQRGRRGGLRFASITSHQHVHMISRVSAICVALAKEQAIPAVRLTRFAHIPVRSRQSLKSMALRPFVPGARRAFRRADVLFNDFALELPAGGRPRPAERFAGVLQRLRGGTYEVVCHPGFVDETLRQRDPYTVERELELEILTDAALRALLRDGGPQFTTFGALAASATERARTAN